MSKSDILVCPGIRSSHQDANIVKNILLREKCLEKRCQIRHEGKFVIFPLIKGKSEVVRDLLPKDSELVDSEGFFLRSTKESPISFLRKNLPKEVIAFIPSSYDVVGDVVLLKLDAHLIPSKELIAEAFLRYNNARTVLNKIADVSTEFRTPQWEVIGGSPRTDTIITLHGMKLSVDVARSYFNPRLGNEYQRIANLINDGETVWDLFCGVGPFSILGAIRSPATFLANDLNPVAVGCLKTNIEMNSKKLRGEVKPSNRDVMDLIQDDLPMPKRVIMNLPGRSMEFFPHIVSKIAQIKPKSSPCYFFVHLYYFAYRSESEHEYLDRDLKIQAEVRRIVKGNALKVQSLSLLPIRDVSPSKGFFVMDLEITD